MIIKLGTQIPSTIDRDGISKDKVKGGDNQLAGTL